MLKILSQDRDLPWATQTLGPGLGLVPIESSSLHLVSDPSVVPLPPGLIHSPIPRVFHWGQAGGMLWLLPPDSAWAFPHLHPVPAWVTAWSSTAAPLWHCLTGQWQSSTPPPLPHPPTHSEAGCLPSPAPQPPLLPVLLRAESQESQGSLGLG